MHYPTRKDIISIDPKVVKRQKFILGNLWVLTDRRWSGL